MPRQVLIVGLLCLAALPGAAGEVLENLAAPSPALGRDLRYHVYLPDEHVPDANLPVVYLLHGFGAGPNEWVNGADLPATLDRMIAAGQIAPVIAVMPDGAKSWYVDSAATGGPGDFETAIARDLVTEIDRRFETAADPRHRAIAGNSMGGFGALRLAFAHPDIFGAVAGLAPALYKDGTNSRGRSPAPANPTDRDKWYAGVFGTPFDLDTYLAHAPFALAEGLADRPDPPRILLISGDDDFFDLQEGTVELYLDLRYLDLVPELRIGDGGHNWRFWTPMAVEAFRFFDAGWQEAD